MTGPYSGFWNWERRKWRYPEPLAVLCAAALRNGELPLLAKKFGRHLAVSPAHEAV
jgi:hypothetical protein